MVAKANSFLAIGDLVINFANGNKALRFVHTRDVNLVSDAISIETLPSFQIATAGDSDNM